MKYTVIGRVLCVYGTFCYFVGSIANFYGNMWALEGIKR
jgi:hypothetical protein